MTPIVMSSVACGGDPSYLTLLLKQIRVKQFVNDLFSLQSEMAEARSMPMDNDCIIGQNGDTSVYPPPPCFDRGSALGNGSCLCDLDREPGYCQKCGQNFKAVDLRGDPYAKCVCPPGFELVDQRCVACNDGRVWQLHYGPFQI
jgi:hypothetical protein